MTVSEPLLLQALEFGSFRRCSMVDLKTPIIAILWQLVELYMLWSNLGVPGPSQGGGSTGRILGLQSGA